MGREHAKVGPRTLGPWILRILGASLLCVAGAAQDPEEKEKPMSVQNGREVSIEYTLSLEDGVAVDSNVGEDPLAYRHGAQQILPALEQELVGLKVGESKRVVLPPEKAYGAVQPEAFQEVEIQLIPEGAREVGALLIAEDGEGDSRRIRIHEVKEQTVVLDFNHPLAGHTLTFNVKILGIR